jgi:hypothetical protein
LSLGKADFLFLWGVERSGVQCSHGLGCREWLVSVILR